MPHARSSKLQQALTLLAALLILKVTVAVVLSYRNYFPPNFNADFLRGREGYFFASYQWPFYAHIASGPVSLVLGMMLVSDRFRMRFPKWHRYLGRVQVAGILLLVSPSGLWMAYYAQTGAVAGVSFALLAILTAVCAALGWKAAMQRRFAVHRRWMSRSFLLLCSAVVLRLLGGLATVSGVTALWFDPLASWACWMAPLAAYELNGLRNRRYASWAVPAHSLESATESFPAMEIIARRASGGNSAERNRTLPSTNKTSAPRG